MDYLLNILISPVNTPTKGVWDMSYAYKEIGSRVRRYRKAISYTTSDLASKLDVSVGLINNLENGRNDVFRLELLSEMSKELGVPVAELLDFNTAATCEANINGNEVFIRVQLYNDKHIVHKDLLNEQISILVTSYISTILYLDLPQSSIIKLTDNIKNILEFIKTKE